MANPETLRQLCFDEQGDAKPKDECRAALINHLILDELMDIDEAEDIVDKTLKALNLWPELEKESPESP